MAPPRHRDRGFSRRIQLGLFLGYVAAAIGILVALALLVVQRLDPTAFALIRGAALDLTAPLTGGGRSVVRGSEAVAGEVSAYLDAARQNRTLRASLDAARREAVAARAQRAELGRLRRLVRLIDPARPPVATARIVGGDPAGTRRFAILAAGRNDGIRPGQPIRNADGVVGRIFETGASYARVLLVTDAASSVPVRVVRSGLPALAAGRGDGFLDIRATGAGGTPFQRGDLLLTSGTGGLYPPELPVAVVVRIDGEAAVARPLADPARLDLAIVLPVFAALPPPRP